MIPRHYNCTVIAGTAQFTGDLEVGMWASAKWTETFVDIEGDLRPAPPLSTRVKMTWDESNLYIGAYLEEPHLWATLTEHDCVIFQDNDFEIFIDPDGDNHNYFEIEINALNTTWDLHLPKPYRDKGSARNEWEIPGFASRVTLHGTLNDAKDRDRGWTLETSLPWSAFEEYGGVGVPPSPGDIWRINFSRVEWELQIVEAAYRKVPGTPEHNWVWSPMGVVDMHRPERWGTVCFARDTIAAHEPSLQAEHTARDQAMKLYYQQHAYFAEHGSWCEDPAAVNAPLGTVITTSNTGFRASLPWVHPLKGAMTITVSEDSRLTITSSGDQR